MSVKFIGDVMQFILDMNIEISSEKLLQIYRCSKISQSFTEYYKYESCCPASQSAVVSGGRERPPSDSAYGKNIFFPVLPHTLPILCLPFPLFL
jgi:hypothetical protein